MKAPGMARRADILRCLALYPLPHHALSRLVGWITRLRVTWLKNALIRAFVRVYRVNLAETDESHTDWPDFNAFFTRSLRPDQRPGPDTPQALACPADGILSAIGTISAGQAIQAKGQRFSIDALLGGDPELAERFRDGAFATVYLSPRDYHRVHMPCAGRPARMIHVPGRLFSVAPHTVRGVPRLFARNERVICLFDGDAGPFALILVGAIFVASIETAWHGVVTPPAGRRVRAWSYTQLAALPRGAEMGRFNMGSTVIALYPRGQIGWDQGLESGQRLRMGQALGHRL